MNNINLALKELKKYMENETDADYTEMLFEAAVDIRTNSDMLVFLGIVIDNDENKELIEAAQYLRDESFQKYNLI